jgi:LPS-assembly protein
MRMLHASRMKVNDETGRASVKNAWLEFKSVPVMYFPYGSFPIDDRRLTGFLGYLIFGHDFKINFTEGSMPQIAKVSTDHKSTLGHIAHCLFTGIWRLIMI